MQPTMKLFCTSAVSIIFFFFSANLIAHSELMALTPGIVGPNTANVADLSTFTFIGDSGNNPTWALNAERSSQIAGTGLSWNGSELEVDFTDSDDQSVDKFNLNGNSRKNDGVSTTVGIEVTEINLELAAYPNPTNSTLTVNIGNYYNEKLTYQLYDMQGKLLDSKQVVSTSTTIDMQDLQVNTYLLSVLDKNSLIKTFRIVKN